MMRKNVITIVLFLIIATIVVVIGAFLIKTADKPADSEVDSEQQAEPAPEPNIGESDTPENQPTDNSTADTTPTDDGTTDTAPTDDSVQTTPDTPVTNEPTVDTPAVTVPVTAPTSYKEFSLTKGMSASDAATKLDSFLSSKYSILLNKQHKVASDYVPSDLITPSGCQYPMERVAGNALVQLLSAARADGISDLVLYSGYRTVASQKNKFETRTNKYLSQGYSQAEAEEKAGEYIAPPGASEHHTGLAADVCSSAIVNRYGYLSDTFDTTKEYRWMKEHCAEYGFIIRYTKGDEAITGYSYEPWHLRYLGVEHATACTKLGLTYEEYYTMITKFRDEAKAEA